MSDHHLSLTDQVREHAIQSLPNFRQMVGHVDQTLMIVLQDAYRRFNQGTITTETCVDFYQNIMTLLGTAEIVEAGRWLESEIHEQREACDA